MPEGDTIHKLAVVLSRRWVGRTADWVELSNGAEANDARDRRVEAVEAIGKHLIVRFEGGLLLRTHLGMYGSWHHYGLTEPWKRSRRQASVVLKIGDEVFVCFNAMACEWLRAGGVRERMLGVRLGADLARPGVEISGLVERARELAVDDPLIVDVLLDQRIACGIGNVYKSEVLFLNRVNPDARLSELTDLTVLQLYRKASALLHRNLQPGPRVTRFGGDTAGGLWVYRRAGQACFACGSRICYRRTGRNARSTYWCPVCQR